MFNEIHLGSRAEAGIFLFRGWRGSVINPTCAGVAVSGECVVLRRGDCRSDGPLLSTAQGECLSTCFSLL